MDNDESLRFYRFKDYQLDVAERLLIRNGREVQLTPTLFEILLILVENHGRILEKEWIIARVWPGRVVEEGNLARNVSTLRKILRDDPQDPRYIETISRRGYRFVAEVVAGHEAQEETPRASRPPEALPSRPSTLAHGNGASDNERRAERVPVERRALGTSLLMACVILAAAALVAPRLVVDTNSRVGDGSPIRSLAVLPLVDLSAERNEEYFADGLTDALIASLGKIAALSVTSRTSAMHYKGSAKRVPQIAHELGVDAIVEGSVLRSADRFRIAIRLVDAAADRPLWTETYERDVGDVLALQGEIARTIAQRIEIAVTPEESRRLAAARPVDPEAQEAYLRGLFFKNKQSVDSLHKAIALFERALRKEPDFAPAYAAMADTYLILASWQGPSRAFWPKAREAAHMALRIDDTLAEAHVVLAGALLCHDLNQAGAEPLFLRALHLNPNDETARLRYGYSLITEGRIEESLAQTRRAVELDPVSLVSNTSLGRSLHLAGRHDDAVRQLQNTLELDASFPSAHRYLGLAYLAMGKPDEAIRALEKSFALGGGPGVLGELGYAYALAERIDDALRELTRLEEFAREGRDSAFSIALIHNGLGDEGQALHWLEKAYEERDFRMILLLVDPIWDTLRPDPRFEQLLLQIGLVPSLPA